eukprot:TRINITY_DN48738_c0_g1_i1.p1 TRINITY_DN48738_c0_g1~~TRINITY_DN48738_c0_g1_i1.p1  ORF type:complete len:375 (+),score=62.18 TRINITY_DN48738_c0_g1_i1:74-1198(+)
MPCRLVPRRSVEHATKISAGGGRRRKRPLDTGEYAYCCVLYGSNKEYVLLLLVFVYRLFRLDKAAGRSSYPFLVLPTADVDQDALDMLRRAGCTILPCVDYIEGHSLLFAKPDGRHRNVFTKLRVLGLTDYDKILLLDADLLPRRPLFELFDLEPPAAYLMPAFLPSGAKELQAGELVPTEWLWPNSEGRAARINCGVCLLRPDRELLNYIERQVSPRRSLWADERHVVHTVFERPWRPSWTPEEDAITRALDQRGVRWRSLGCAWNFEVMNDSLYHHDTPYGKQRLSLRVPRDVGVLHFVTSDKPSWDAWWVFHGCSIDDCMYYVSWRRSEKAEKRKLISIAWREWFEAFRELLRASPDEVSRLLTNDYDYDR